MLFMLMHGLFEKLDFLFEHVVGTLPVEDRKRKARRRRSGAPSAAQRSKIATA
ncbi:hypothetical protein [Rhizobium freirei]|uniref:hypothetical protein n=1 Tax=Rhizobium freirei TaxID=1353277 RepID=UPI0012FB6C03|nr:hypothetical protein [Rhizobium freirei]